MKVSQAKPIGAVATNITFEGADLSADNASIRLPVPVGADGKPCTRASLYLECTATGSPVGVFIPKNCVGLRDAGVAIENVDAMTVDGAESFDRTGLELDGATHFGVDWDWTSGGAGATVTAVVVFYG